MDNKLIVKHPNIPLRGYPEDLLKIILYGTDDEPGRFAVWISNLLGLTGETSAKRLYLALPAIEKHFLSMNFQEITKIFEMYADGQLSIQPRTNYFDRILVGQIFEAYRKEKQIKMEPKKTEDELKAEEDNIKVIMAFDFYVQEKGLPLEYSWIYDYLKEKGIINYTNGAVKQAFKMCEKTAGTEENQKQQAKIMLICDHFKKLHENKLHVKNQL